MKPRRWIENLLLLGGLVALNVWVWTIAVTGIFQSWQNWVFEQEVHGRSAPVSEFVSARSADVAGQFLRWWGFPKDRAVNTEQETAKKQTNERLLIPPNGLVGRLTIPRLALSAMVRQGAGEDTLRFSLGHIPGTAFPGQSGNVGIAGHRDTLFRGLRNIGKNDLIEVETLRGKYLYQVESTEIVKPTDVSVLKAANYPQLTLVTCFPFYYVGSAPDRFIVKARQVRQPRGGGKTLVSRDITPGSAD